MLLAAVERGIIYSWCGTTFSSRWMRN